MLLEAILRNKNFSFIDRFFLQLVGLAMGHKDAPPYANFFIVRHEEIIYERRHPFDFPRCN